MHGAELIPLGQMYATSFEKFARRPAVRDDRENFTYAELGVRARRLASALRGLGLGRGDRVAIVSNNSAQWVQLDRAAALGGFARVALLPRLHPVELTQIGAGPRRPARAAVTERRGCRAAHGSDQSFQRWHH